MAEAVRQRKCGCPTGVVGYTRRIMSYGLGLGSGAPVSGPLAQIRTKDGYSYQVTPEDLLWLARSVQFEGGDNAATIWTYAQRQAKLRRTSSLASLVRAHSQPINPIWDEASDPKCRQYPDRCTPAMLERRRRAATTPWSSLRSGVRDKVTRWARAELPNPVPKAIDFADAAVSRSFMRRNPGTQVVLRTGNWYLATPASLRWPADYVTMSLGGRVAGPTAGGALRAGPIVGIAAVGASALFAAGAAWYYFRNR